MVASPVTLVNGEAMPENVVQHPEYKCLTSTKPHDSFEFVGPTSLNQTYHSVLLRDGDGVTPTFVGLNGLKQAFDYWAYHWTEIHVLQRPAADYNTLEAFHNTEVVRSTQSPWIKHDWYRNNMLRWAELLPVPSETQEGYIAYYQTPEKRVRNIRTPIKPGRFLSKYFGDILNQEQIQQFAAEYEAATKIHAPKITQDADEIEDVYRSNYLNSCMHFGDGGFGGPVHPARVYAGPDLGIAYLGSRSFTAARCLVWPEKKIYLTKGYGDKERLYAGLRQLGYTGAGNFEFQGARLQRIECGSGFVLPYVDTNEYVRDDGSYLILDNSGSIWAQAEGGGDGTTNGSDEDDDRISCDDCGSREDSYDIYRTYHGGDLCEDCRDRNYFYCELTSSYHHDDDRANTADDDSVSEVGVQNSSHWFYCEKSELWYNSRRYNKVETIEGETCELNHAVDNGFFCSYSEQYSFVESKRIKLSNDTDVHLDSFDSKAELDAYLNNIDATIVFHPRDTDTLELELEAA